MAYTDVNDRARFDRLEVIRAQLMERLRPICGEMPQELFLEMVESMAAIQLKYELKTANGSS